MLTNLLGCKIDLPKSTDEFGRVIGGSVVTVRALACDGRNDWEAIVECADGALVSVHLGRGEKVLP